MARLEDYDNEFEGNDDDSRQRAQRVRSQESYKRTPPKRKAAPATFNGIHRRRKKRVNW